MQTITSVLGNLPPLVGVTLLAAAFLTTCVHFAMEPLRWKHAYLPGESSQTDISNVRDSLYTTALATYFLPFKLGVPLRIALLKRIANLSTSHTIAILTIDGILSLCVWAAIAATCIWVTALHWSPPKYFWLLAALVISAVAVLVLLRKNRKKQVVQKVLSAISLLNRPVRRISIAASITVLDVTSYGVRHALLLWLTTGRYEIALVGGAIGIMATFSGILSGFPMGIVGYDASLIALLSMLGVDLSHSATVIILNRSMNLVAAACVGVPAGIRLGLGHGLSSILKKLRETGNGKN